MVLESPGKPGEKFIKAAMSHVILNGDVHTGIRGRVKGSSLESHSWIKAGNALGILFSYFLFLWFFEGFFPFFIK